MYTVEFLHDAEIEIADACKWYDEQQKGLGRRFLKEVNIYLSLVSKNPFQFNVRFSGKFRFATLQVFPYSLVYSVDEQNKIIYVNTMFHTSRDPQNF